MRRFAEFTLKIQSRLGLPQRSFPAETAVASLGLTVRHADQTAGGRDPPDLAFWPSDLPVNNLDRAQWPGFDTEASAIQAAVWQPNM
jgi:hypothetical protein